MTPRRLLAALPLLIGAAAAAAAAARPGLALALAIASAGDATLLFAHLLRKGRP